MGSFLTGATGTGNSYAAQSAPLQLQQIVPQINTALTNENNLGSQLQAQALGAGPNPAQQQLQQATSSAIQQGAGMVANQKGINPALAQRQAAQNASATSQQAAGQGALMQAQQQAGAQGAQAGLYGSQLGALEGAQTGQNQAILGNTQQMNNVNSNVAAQNAQQSGNLFGGLIGGAAGAVGLASGGMVPTWQQWAQPSMATSGYGIGQGLGSAIQNLFSGPSKPASGPGSQEDSDSGGLLTAGAQQQENQQSGLPLYPQSGFFNGGKIKPHLHAIASIYHPHMMKTGGPVAGKANVQGDSPTNDTVPAMLSPGEMVIPRSVMESKDPAKSAADFVAEKLKEKLGSNEDHGDFKEALKKAILSRKAS